MSAIRWPQATRDALAEHRARTGRPAAAVIRDALQRIVNDPAGALTGAAPFMTTNPGIGRRVPISPADMPLWRAAEERLGPAVAVGVVVRAFVTQILAEDEDEAA